MKSLQGNFFRLFNFVLSGILTILGFSGCEGESRVEYGSPYATFIVGGSISSVDTDDPVENIKVVMVKENFYGIDSAFTDNSGLFEVKDGNGFPQESAYLIKIRDVDGNANGAFEDLDTTVVFEDPDFEGGGSGWYEGETSKEFNIKLTPKK